MTYHGQYAHAVPEPRNASSFTVAGAKAAFSAPYQNQFTETDHITNALYNYAMSAGGALCPRCLPVDPVLPDPTLLLYGQLGILVVLF